MNLLFLTVLCLILFASNSILCRSALAIWEMEPYLYVAIRSLSATMMLVFLCSTRIIRSRVSQDNTSSVWKQMVEESSWIAALALFVYMLTFSLSYVRMPSAVGILICNFSVQATMIGWSVYCGISPKRLQWIGLTVSIVAFIILVSPGLTSPPLWNSILMLICGMAWSVYSIVGRKAQSASLATAGNFLRCIPFALAAGTIGLVTEDPPQTRALACALASGALASGCGYIVWYTIVPRYSIVCSSIIQLTVPIITALLALLLLDEVITLRFIVCSTFILGGIYMVIVGANRS